MRATFHRKLQVCVRLKANISFSLSRRAALSLTLPPFVQRSQLWAKPRSPCLLSSKLRFLLFCCVRVNVRAWPRPLGVCIAACIPVTRARWPHRGARVRSFWPVAGRSLLLDRSLAILTLRSRSFMSDRHWRCGRAAAAARTPVVREPPGPSSSLSLTLLLSSFRSFFLVSSLRILCRLAPETPGY